MKRYIVSIPIAGAIHIEVEAESAKHAREQAARVKRTAETRCYVGPLYTTRSGVLVEERDRRAESSGRVKIAAYRWHTGGFHGWLWLDNLRAVRR